MKLKCLAAALAVSLSPETSASWVNDWVDNAVYSGGDSFKGRNRTFLSGGNFSMRNKVKTDHPITISPPRFSAGCGGIDGFMGGFAFLDADYLGDKLQSMVTVAPYIAIDMALKAMSKEMSDTLKNAEQIINALNGIQLNECDMMTPIVAMPFGGSGEDVKDVWKEQLNVQAIKDNTSRFWNEFNKDTETNDGKAAAGSNMQKEVVDCPKNVTDLFKEGSLITNIATATGMTEYKDLIRGYLGDVNIKYDTVIQGTTVESCPNNANSVEGFLYGSGQEKDDSGKCKNISISMFDSVMTSLDDISAAAQSPDTELSAKSKDFINRSQLPIIPMLNTGVQLGSLDHIKESVAEVVALNFASSATRDFYQNTYEALRRLQQTLKNPSDEGKRCNFKAYVQPAELAKDLLKETQEFKKQIDIELNTRINMINQNQEFINNFMRLKKDAEQNMKNIKG